MTRLPTGPGFSMAGSEDGEWEQVAKSLGSFWKLRPASKWGPGSYNKRWDPSNNLEADSS